MSKEANSYMQEGKEAGSLTLFAYFRAKMIWALGRGVPGSFECSMACTVNTYEDPQYAFHIILIYFFE